jgi:cardiolipin synthase
MMAHDASSLQESAVCQCEGDSVQVFVEGDALYGAMRADIAAARQNIDLEAYILSDDAVGRAIVAALCERSAAGVRVRVGLDAFGSLPLANSPLTKELRDAGVRLHWHHGWSWRHPWHIHRRNHRKLLVLDRQCAYLGGFNLRADSSQHSTGGGRWRDTHVRIQGPFATQAQAAFDSFWSGDLHWQPSQMGPNLLMTNASHPARNHLRVALHTACLQARQRIWATTPYFIPDRRLRTELAGAARRGVDVRILVPRHSDVRLVQWASRSAYRALLHAGVKVFEYRPRVLHAKTMVVDGSWCTVGTANLDYRSFNLNLEINLVSRCAALTELLAAQFEFDMTRSELVDPALWHKRPSWRSALEAVAWRLRRWL